MKSMFPVQLAESCLVPISLILLLVVGCVGGAITQEDFSSVLASLQEAFEFYQEVSEALEGAQNEGQEEEKVEEIRARLDAALESFIYWRERLKDSGSLGRQKAQEYKIAQ